MYTTGLRGVDVGVGCHLTLPGKIPHNTPIEEHVKHEQPIDFSQGSNFAGSLVDHARIFVEMDGISVLTKFADRQKGPGDLGHLPCHALLRPGTGLEENLLLTRIG